MYALLAYMSINCVYAWCLERPRGLQIPWSWSLEHCEQPCSYWESGKASIAFNHWPQSLSTFGWTPLNFLWLCCPFLIHSQECFVLPRTQQANIDSVICIFCLFYILRGMARAFVSEVIVVWPAILLDFCASVHWVGVFLAAYFFGSFS